MGLECLVCLKMVPDTTNIRINPETGTLIREGVPSIINPYDLHALEAAINLKKEFGGRVTVITMGPPGATKILEEAVEQGADRTVLLSDRKFAGADTLATSYTLTEAIKYLAREREFDFLFFGKQAIDGDTAQVGPGVATRLNLPLVTYVQKIRSVSLAEKTCILERKLEEGVEVVEASFPLVLTCEKAIAKTSFAPLVNLIRAKQHQPLVFSASEPVEYDFSKLGLKGSPTRVHKVFTPELRQGGEKIRVQDIGLKKAVDLIVEKLRELKVI